MQSVSDAMPIKQLSPHGLLLNIIESIPTRVFWKDNQGHYLGCNKSFALDSGLVSPEEVVGKTEQDMPWHAITENDKRVDQQIISSGEPLLNSEEPLVSAEGKTIWRKISRAPLYDDEHHIIGIIGMYDDITGYKEGEHDAYLAKFVLDHAPMNVSFLDEQARIRYINKEGAKSLGYSHEELLNMSIPDIDLLYPEEKWARHWQDLKDHKIVPVQTTHQRKNGEQFPVDVIANYIEFNHQAYNVAFIVDRTEREKHERLLKASKEKFETLFNASTDAQAILSLEGKFLDVNRTAYERLGYTKEEMLSLSVEDLVSPEEAVKAAERAAYLQKHGSIRFEGVTNKKDGSTIPVEIHSQIISLEGRDVIFNVSRDISERKQLEEQLLQSQKMEAIGTLVGGIAHDFNNLLAAIQGNLYLATKQVSSNPLALEKLANIDQLSNRAADMVQQLLTFARKDTVIMQPILINALLQESNRLIRTTIPENISHCVDICSEPMVVRGNQTQIQQILINLVNNARDALAGTDKPNISCSLTPYTASHSFMQKHPEQKHRHFACLTIEDNGSGMEEKTLEKIFEPFYTTKETGEGTGLGLSMVYGAMQSHGGEIEVESQPGRGTTFHMYFPVIDAKLASEPPKEAGSSTITHATILLVDDEITVREVAAEVLREMGYTVIEANHGEHALQIFHKPEHQIDLIITDVVMPKMGGHELFAKIRAANRTIPIILVTGYDRSHVLKTNIKLEHFEVINKPFNYDILSRQIQSLLQSRGAS